MNDIVDSLKNNADIHLYAADTKLLRYIHTTDDRLKLQEDLNGVKNGLMHEC